MTSGVDVKAILDLCRLKNLSTCENGWRASTIFDTEKIGDSSLSISRDGMFTCFRTQKTGSIVTLYSQAIGKPYRSAKAELRMSGLIPKLFSDLQHKEDVAVEENKVDDRNGSERILAEMRMDIDWLECSKWRGIPMDIIKHPVNLGFLSYIDSYPVLGSSYVFVANNPPSGEETETKGIMLRSALANIEKKDRWRTPMTYPIWAPVWNVGAENIIFTEGQWDALAMYAFTERFKDLRDWNKYQILALCGAKKIEKYPEIMDYLSGKKVWIVPDTDIAGEKILAELSVKLDQVVADQKLMRIDHHKDLNDFYKSNPTQDEFEIWLESEDPFRVSNGVIVDSIYRNKHKLKIDSIIEVDEQGDPVEVYTGEKEAEKYLSADYILDILDPFPVMHEYVKACLASIESPPIYHVCSFMTYAAALMGRRFKLETGSNNCLYPNLFTLLVGPSGIGKSEAIHMLKGIVSKINSRLFTSNNFSAESLIDEFSDCPQRMLVADEFSPWMQAREGGYRFWAMKNFLEMYDCHRFSSNNPYVINFRKTKRIEIEYPCFSVLSACTTEQMLNVNPQLLTDGTIGRFFFPLGLEKHSSIAFPKRIGMSVLENVERLFRAIHGTPIRENVSMSFTQKSRSFYESAFNNQETKNKASDPVMNSRSYTSRWRVRLQKFSIIFEVLRPVHQIYEDRTRKETSFSRSDMMISDEAIIAAMKLTESLEHSFNLAFGDRFSVSDTNSFSSKLQYWILNYMKKNSNRDGTGVPRTQIMRFSRSSKREFDEAVSGLTEGGVLMERKLRMRRSDGTLNLKPTITYLLTKENNVRLTSMPANSNHNGSNQNNGQNNNSNHH